MNWKESLEDFRRSMLPEERKEEERRAGETPSGKEPPAVDEAAGSECLDD